MRALLVVFLALVACGGGGSPAAAPQSADAFDTAQPDVVLLTVSGRNLDLGNLFCPPACNEAYLGDPGRAGEALLTALTNAGLTVETRHYIAALRSYDDEGDGDALPDRLGCLKLIGDLRWIRDHWVDGQASPTRIVLVGHSHGCVWAHNVTAALPDVSIDVLVSLDGVSTLWESDHGPSIDAYYADEGGNPFPIDLRDVTAVWSGSDTKDIVFDNVGFDIEVRSDNDCTVCLFDAVDNKRLDGSFEGIVSIESNGEDHSRVTQSGSAGLQFVVDHLLVALIGPG